MKSFVCFALLFFILASCQNQMPVTNIEPTSPAAIQLFYVGTYTRAEGHVDGRGTGIYTVMFSATGALKLIDTSAATINPSYLAQHPSGKYLYAVNEHGGAGTFSTGTVSAFEIGKKGALTLLNTQSSEGDAPCHLAVAPDGSVLYVANYMGGNFAVINLNADGSLGDVKQVIEHQGSGPNTERQEAPHGHYIGCAPDGKSVWTCDLGTDEVQHYAVNENGELTLQKTIKTQAGGGPRHLHFSPSGNFIYVLNELTATVQVFDFQGVEQQTVSMLPTSYSGQKSGAALRIHPSGKFIYASNRNEHHSIVGYRIDKKTELLETIGYFPTGGKTPRDFAVDPSGRFLIVAHQDDSNLTVFSIDQGYGNLSATSNTLEVPTPVCLLF